MHSGVGAGESVENLLRMLGVESLRTQGNSSKTEAAIENCHLAISRNLFLNIFTLN
jgi:hypothetical protein